MIKWYTDADAEAAYKQLKESLGPQLAHLFPGFEFTHFGVNKVSDESTGGIREVRIALHMRPTMEARALDAQREVMFGTRRLT